MWGRPRCTADSCAASLRVPIVDSPDTARFRIAHARLAIDRAPEFDQTSRTSRIASDPIPRGVPVMTRFRSFNVLVALSAAVSAGAQPPQAADPNVKKKDLYRVAGGSRDGVS